MFNPPAELRVDFYKSQDDAWKWKVRRSQWTLHDSAAVRSQLPTASDAIQAFQHNDSLFS
jgi:hypothetical protein